MKYRFVVKMSLVCLLILGVVGCQKGADHEKLMNSFLKEYYETSEKEVNEYIDFEANLSYEDKSKTDEYLKQRNQLELFNMLDTCTERYMDTLVNARFLANIPEALKENDVASIKVGSMKYEKEYGDKDVQYYLHETEIELTYLDGHTENQIVEGRIGINLKENKVDSYRIDKALFNEKVI